jgi:poly(3-hydroxybutyrate) depolymerase
LNILRSLMLVAAPDGVTWDASSVTWSWLQKFGNMVVAAPNGWCDPRTFTSQNPNGVASWDNHFMNGGALAAGWDDVQMLYDLRNYLRTQFGLTGVTLSGHSNGGMMVQRIIQEHPTWFQHYCSSSGPLPREYWSQHALTFPNQPYFASFGGQDATINLVGSPGGVFADVWYQTLSSLSVADNNSPNLSTWIGDFTELGARFQAVGTATAPTQTSGTTTSVKVGTQTRWTSNDGRVLFQYMPQADHSIKSYQATSGRSLFVDWCRWIVNT